MKKIIYLLAGITLFTSCQNEIDTFNESPNNPSVTTPSLLLVQAEVTTFNIHSTDISRFAGIFTQQLAGNDFQYATYGQYVFTETDIINHWDTFYLNVGVVCYDNIQKFGAQNPYYGGMSKILLALNMAKATDYWNDIPLSEAFKGREGIEHPKYDTQESVYAQLQTLLSDAITDLSQPESANFKKPATDDLIYGGDPQKWIKAAYTLKARYALRLTNRDGAAVAAQKALDYLAAGGISSNEDDMNAYFFADKPTEYNQWYAFEQSRPNYIKMGKYFVDLLKNSNDPRLPLFVGQDTKGGYTGVAADETGNNDASSIGPAFNGKDKPLGMVTFAEAKFIEAEAKLILGDASAQQAFKDGVSASLLNYVGSVDNTYVDNATSTVNLENIITQKYIALFGSPEPYNDWRRTGFPSITPNPTADPPTIPLRLPTSQKERLYNPNATVVSNTTSPVWWDNN